VIIHSRLESTHLAGNLLGDPSERDLFVYLPPGYEDSGRRYPTAYLLHAFGGTADRVAHPPTDEKWWAPPIEDVFDPVFGRMGTAPMIVVIPDGWTRYGCSQWVDSPVNGNFDQYVLDDVVGYVDAHHRTIPDPRSRGVFGFSSGGFGAWHLASRNPDDFGAMAMLSGDSYFDLTHKSIVYEFFESIWPEAPSGPIEGNYVSQMAYALSACYSPNVEKPPFYVDLPIGFPNGELIDDVWARWLSFDPVVNFRDRLSNLRKLSGILLDVGWNDDAHLQWGHRLLSHHLHQAGITHETRENPGNHGGRSRESYQMALQWLSEILQREPPL
jgi:S-formylglutathione hydrolase FrmB